MRKRSRWGGGGGGGVWGGGGSVGGVGRRRGGVITPAQNSRFSNLVKNLPSAGVFIFSGLEGDHEKMKKRLRGRDNLETLCWASSHLQ